MDHKTSAMPFFKKTVAFEGEKSRIYTVSLVYFAAARITIGVTAGCVVKEALTITSAACNFLKIKN